jgi:hypothetical protein
VSRRTPDGKRTRELLRRLPPGFSLVNRGRGHLVVVRPDGEELRTGDGVPLRIASTTNDGGGGIKHDLARIRRAIRGQR